MIEHGQARVTFVPVIADEADIAAGVEISAYAIPETITFSGPCEVVCIPNTPQARITFRWLAQHPQARVAIKRLIRRPARIRRMHAIYRKRHR